MNLGQLVSLGFSTPRDLWSWLLVLSMLLKIGSTLVLLALKAGQRWHWTMRHEQALWWSTKLSAPAICACAAVPCHLGDDTTGKAFFISLLLIAAMLVARQIAQRRAQQPARP